MNKLNLKRIISLLMCLIFLLQMSACKSNSSPENTTSAPPQTDGSDDKNSSTEPSTKDVNVTTEKLVALTFDDGPYSPVTEKILDVLEQYNSHATFFVVGNRVQTYKNSVKRAVDLGCEIGSHTQTHKNLAKLGQKGIREQISSSCQSIKEVCGCDVTIVRPPEGAVNSNVRNCVNYPLIAWSVDSMDWKNKNVQKNYDNVINSVFDGAIVLMHDLYPATADAVEKIVPELIARGYKLVTVSELMKARNVDLQPGNRYFSAKPAETETTSK